MPPMPGMPTPPPGLAGGTGPASVPTPMMGAATQGVAGVKTALELLQKALGSVPLGSDLHMSVLKAVTDLSKHMNDLPSQPGGQDVVQQLAQLARQAQSGGANPLAGMMPGAGGPPPGGGAPPMGGGGLPMPPPMPSPQGAM